MKSYYLDSFYQINVYNDIILDEFGLEFYVRLAAKTTK